MSDVCSRTNKRDAVGEVQLQSQKGILEEVEQIHSKYSCSRLHLQKEQRSGDHEVPESSPGEKCWKVQHGWPVDVDEALNYWQFSSLAAGKAGTRVLDGAQQWSLE